MVSVKNFEEFINAIEVREEKISITRSFLIPYPVILPEGVSISGKAQEDGALPLLSFQNNDGLGLTKNNTIADLNIQTSIENRAIFLTNKSGDLGKFTFKNLMLTGQFSFIARNNFEKADVEIDGIDIIAADARRYLEQPQKYGVNVLQGALTVYNFNSNENSKINLAAKNVSIGRRNAPVIGSGIFIAGFGDEGGRTEVSTLETKAVYSNGKIPVGVSDFITAAVFIVNGTFAKSITHNGEIATYGVNDMVLDTWGKVDTWESNDQVISYGPSGIGFVNFGIVNNFIMHAPLKTFGQGARGYNQYDGTLKNGIFDSISTYGDGSIGIQISKKVGSIVIKNDITTHGGLGNSLVKGVNILLPAYAISIKNAGEVDDIEINGSLITHGSNVTTYIVENGGIVHHLEVSGTVDAKGINSQPVKIEKGGLSTQNFLAN
ncbi:hypothetical protein WOSG25_050890 [Weissella oryzae SG25]|uniref:Uncharacterized protein n=1 Tax=Weissella oryzae (strain DSM 25784 / JCM 18191 / LMG 30913 / SG25) TaxID=1329250 RepID=A0A069CTX1_WEIOS|nr:hypothetical protein [Weissella oryzae]GAK30817.1 hypothetical protein WOSG25_050890 [Weissella oryzae SG25]